MIAAAALALGDALSPPFRAVLAKSIGLAVLLLVVLALLLESAAVRLIDFGNAYLDLVAEILSGFGVIIGVIFLIGPVVSLVAGLFLDDIAERVERTHYPLEVPGRALPVGEAIAVAIRFAALTLGVNLVALAFLLVPGVDIAVWWIANGYLLGREYFELAAMRFRSPTEVRALRARLGPQIFLGGLLIAAFLAIPIVNLATPLVATAFMVHLHRRLVPVRPA